MCTWRQVPLEARKEHRSSIKLDLPAAVSYLIWTLGSELKPSARAVRTPACLAISPYRESYCCLFLYTLWSLCFVPGWLCWELEVAIETGGIVDWGWVTPRPANRFPLEEILTEDFCILRTILPTLGSLKIKSFFFHFCISMNYSDMIDFDCEEGQGIESATTLLWFLLLWNVFMIMATLTNGNI